MPFNRLSVICTLSSRFVLDLVPSKDLLSLRAWYASILADRCCEVVVGLQVERLTCLRKIMIDH